MLILVGAGHAFGQASGFLNLKVVDGDGAFNDIKRKTGHPLSVQVFDENGRPVSGATVTFTAPSFGASGTFADGSRTAASTTDGQGVAGAPGLRPNTIEGRFMITVNARQGGKEGSTTIAQSNTAAGVVANGGHKKAWIIVAIIVAAGAGAGVAFATRSGSSSSSSATPTVLSGGGVTVGAP